MRDSPIFGTLNNQNIVWESFEQQMDRYDVHIKHCKHCQQALKQSQLINLLAIFTALIPLAMSKTIPIRLTGIALFISIKFITNKIIKSILGPEKGDVISAAQYPEKNNNKNMMKRKQK
jgi:hypothetical protein